MTDLKKTIQRDEGSKTGKTPPGGLEEQEDRGDEFGTSEKATRGTNRDADRSGRSKNQGHGHPREERGQKSR